LIADDFQYVALPRLERGVLDQEKEDILLGMLGEIAGGLVLELFLLLFFLLQEPTWVDVVIHVILALEAGCSVLVIVLILWREIVTRDLLAAADGGGVDVDQVIDGHAAVDERLHLLLAVFLDVAAQPSTVVGHLVHHLAVGVCEKSVVLEEVA